MNFIHYFLLTNGLSITIGQTISVSVIQNDILHRLSNGSTAVTVTKDNNLKLLNGGEISKTNHALVWKGIYNNKTKVACKIVVDEKSMNQELKILEALNAFKDPNIEQHDIPKIYYHGKVLGEYDAIAMSLFDETLEDRYLAQNQNLSDLSILVIFRQAVKALQYLNSRNVMHNDISPYNIFLRGAKVFLSDFDIATLNGAQTTGCTRLFASSNYRRQARVPMDDLESLVFSIWYVSNVPMARSNVQPSEGLILSFLDQEAAKARMLEKCEHFKNEHVHEAMKLICADEMISKRPVPNYKRIIDALTVAINKLKGSSNQPEFEWLMDDGIVESPSV